jgi:hypothetical protein
MSKKGQKKNEEMKSLFEKEGITKVKFAELKTILGTLVTACEFLDANGDAVSRGLAIRSLKDGYIKKRCKNKAFGRAIKALCRKDDFYPIRDEIPRDEDVVNRVIKYETEEEKCDCKEILRFAVKNKPISSKEGKGYRITISSLFPLFYAKQYFNYKSEYKPFETITKIE